MIFMPTVFVVHAGCGSGHTMAARAVYDSLKEQPGIEVVFCDLLDESEVHRRWYGNGYRFLVKYLPFVWKWLYNTSDHGLCRWYNTGEHSFLFPRFSIRLLKRQPDIVISTHFFSSEIVATLKRRGMIRSKLITVVTDFNVHRTWVHRSTDYYVVASEFTSSVLKAFYKIDEEKIMAWGIPLRQGFYALADREELKKKYSIEEKCKNLLIFSSDYGSGPILDIVHKLRHKFGFIVICGKDRKVKKALEAVVDARSLIVKEYCENIWELIALADAVVIKAGGLSVAECLHMKKTMFFMKAFYGQETENVQYISSLEVGFCPETSAELVDVIERVADDEKMISHIDERFNNQPFNNSTLKIKKLVMDLLT